MARIYTRTGDDGSTSLFGGRRVEKHSPRVEAYGTVDELNAILGEVAAYGVAQELEPLLEMIQGDLFELGAELANPPEGGDQHTPHPIQTAHCKRLEETIDQLESSLEPLMNFILPGGSIPAAKIHHARTVCRRAERRVAALKTSLRENQVLVYLNRLSDLLFVMARFQNKADGKPETKWGASCG